MEVLISHKLDMIESVKEGQLLATLIPIDYGEPGKDVYGNHDTS